MTWKIDDPQGDEAAKTKNVVIYGLCSNENGKIRYVGQTTQNPNKRLDSHLHPNVEGKKRRIWKWIQSVKRKGFSISMVTLQENATWNVSEMRWIAWFKDQGVDLVNHTAGGDGCLGRKKTLEEREHLSRVMTGKKKSIEHVKNMSIAQKGKPISSETKAKISAALKGRIPKNLEKIQKANKGLTRTEENKQKISKSLKGRMVTSRAQLMKNLFGECNGLAN